MGRPVRVAGLRRIPGGAGLSGRLREALSLPAGARLLVRKIRGADREPEGPSHELVLVAEGVEGAAAERVGRRALDPWEGAILGWMAERVGPISIRDALARLEIPVGRRDQAAANRVARIFLAAGWEKAQRRVGGVRTWVYRPPSRVPGVSRDEAGRPVTLGPGASAAVTGVTGTSPHACARAPEGAAAPGVAPATGGRDRPPHVPRDEEIWLTELSGCRSVEARNEVIGRWAVAAGGRCSLGGLVPVAELPRGFAGPTMEVMARRYGWETRRIDPGRTKGSPA